MKRWLCLALLAVPLAGCGLPPAFTVASFALDVASYSATGKSVTDHGLSFAFDQDCAVLHVLEDGRICQDRDALAELAPLADPDPAPGQPRSLIALNYLTDSMPGRQLAAAF